MLLVKMGHCQSERFWQCPQTDASDIIIKGHGQPMSSMLIQVKDLNIRHLHANMKAKV